MSAPKGVDKGTSKGKSDGKDDYPLKKGPSVLTVDKQLKLSLPPKPSHGAGKGLMTLAGSVMQGTICRLLTHKEHAVEMVESIIKETDFDLCVEQLTEDLGASGLFDLARVCFSHTLFYFIFSSLDDGCFCF